MEKKICLISALILMFLSCSIGYAKDDKLTEKQLNNEKKEEIFLEESSEKGIETLEFNKSNVDTQEKNIVPVLDLKGGVTKGEVKEEPKTRFESWISGDYMTGDWGGLRSNLEEHGITFGSRYLTGPTKKYRGGGYQNRRDLKGYGLYNLDLTLDTEKMGLWKGGTFYTLYQNKRGMGLTRDYMGDRQTLDSYDFRTMNQLSEYWYQQVWKDGTYRLKAGKQDANAEFCGLAHGFDFLNTSFSIMPTMGRFPTYPEPAMGITAAISPTDWMTVKNGTFDGSGKGSTSGFDTAFNKRSGVYNISELEFKPTIKDLPGRYIGGYWFHTNDIQELTASANAKTFDKNIGCYTAFEQMVYKENKENEKDMQGLTVIGQCGWAPEDRNDVSKYFGGGLHYKGLIPKRDADILGLGTAIAGFSNRLKSIDGRSGQESVIECFYRIKITPWMYIQPDLQYIMNPNGSLQNSFAFTMRTFVIF